MMASEYGVVIPVFNGESTLGEALESVLAQSIPPKEIIIVDDGSTDTTPDVVAKFGTKVQYLRQSNFGPGAATTRGLESLTTRIGATLDADDIWLPEKAAKQLAHLENFPQTSAIFSFLRQFSDKPDDPRSGVVSPGWTRTTMTMRMSLFATVGAICDPPGRRGEMVDWLARAREMGARLEMLEEVLVLRRVRAGSLSDGRNAAKDRGYLQVARAALERRRNAKPSR